MDFGVLAVWMRFSGLSTFPRKSLPVEEVEKLADKGSVVKAEFINGTGIVYVRDPENADSELRFRMKEYEKGTMMPVVEKLWENNEIIFDSGQVSFLAIFEISFIISTVWYGILLLLKFIFSKFKARRIDKK